MGYMHLIKCRLLMLWRQYILVSFPKCALTGQYYQSGTTCIFQPLGNIPT